MNNWLNAQIIPLKVSKTEVVLFKSLKKKILTYTANYMGNESIKQIE